MSPNLWSHLATWWHRLTLADPWEHDPKIKAARDDQHERAQRLQNQWIQRDDRFNQRLRDAWRDQGPC